MAYTLGKPRLLVVSTALHHPHRYRLHNFLPVLREYFNVYAVDIALMSYDLHGAIRVRDIVGRLARTTNRVKLDVVEGAPIITIRSILPFDLGVITTSTVIASRLVEKMRGYDIALASPFASCIPFLVRDLDVTWVYEDVDRFYEFYRNPFMRAIARSIEYSCILESSYVVAASPLLGLEDKALRDNGVEVIPNGINYEFIHGNAKPYSKARREDTIVYVGAIEAWTGLEDAVKAIGILAKRGVKARLLIVGDYNSSYGMRLKAMIHRLGLDNMVFMVGRKPYNEIPRILGMSTIGIILFKPSRLTRMAMPYKVLEYGAAGLPIIAYDTGIIGSLIRRHRAGLVVRPGDIVGVADAIEALLCDRSLRRELAFNADNMSRLYDVKVLARKEAELLLSLAS